jgi:anaerobic selenocysteine-containing dehydrogenase
MERRNFLKISAVTGATAALDGCGKPDVQLIRFIPEEELTPGVATWKPSICTMCPAGCGLMVRVMEGEAEVVRNGELGLIKMGLAKKLEGNPHHPVNRGKLCPRGQAGIQVTYHPDRIKNPLKRTGPRGSGEFQEISWDEAIGALTAQLTKLRSSRQESGLAFMTKPLRGQRRELTARFLRAFGAPPPVTFELFDEAVLRNANLLSFGRAQLPTLDLARSDYVICFGADFLGTWNSPVAQNLAYGEMRQGRPGRRAKFVMVEPRMSQTGANADEWIPARPGTEGVLALGLAHVILNEKPRPAGAAGHAGSLIDGWSKGLPEHTPAAVEKQTGVPAATITRLARELAEHEPTVAIIGGAPLAQTNGLASALAVNALNALLGSVGKAGGVVFTPPSAPGKDVTTAGREPRADLESLHQALARQKLGEAGAIQLLLLYECNPLFAAPPGWGVREALQRIPFIASLGSFIDETSALADLILPDHSPLESWLDDEVESGTPHSVNSLAAPAMRPLHNTRQMPDVFLDLAGRLGGSVATALPFKTFEEMLRNAFEYFLKGKGGKPAMDPDTFWKEVQEQGGLWNENEISFHGLGGIDHAPVQLGDPSFDGASDAFPFHFHPFPSPAFYDGSTAHLPWLQEMPDPLSTAMWSSWVEINPRTAERLGIKQGDQVEVASPHGKLQAPALISPGIAPDVVAMPVGQGHEDFTRYASGRGANPISILAPTVVPETGTLAWAGTRVKVSRVGEGKLVLFAGSLREEAEEHRHR